MAIGGQLKSLNMTVDRLVDVRELAQADKPILIRASKVAVPAGLARTVFLCQVNSPIIIGDCLFNICEFAKTLKSTLKSAPEIVETARHTLVTVLTELNSLASTVNCLVKIRKSTKAFKAA